MIKLHGFGPAFGLPDPSPFVVKVQVLLKIAGLSYEVVRSDPRKAPKGKIPYIDDGGVIVADSTFIRMHLEKARGVDFDKGLSEAQKGAAWAIEKMLEDHLYWLVVNDRWCDRVNFEKGPRMFFDAVPAPLRPFVIAMVGRQVKRTLYGQGLGRHTGEERKVLGQRAAMALSQCLGDKPWLMGDVPCGLDATAFAFVSSGLCPLFQSAVRDSLSAHANLVAYNKRGMDRWFPELPGKM
jgi:glutathione S-transferase